MRKLGRRKPDRSLAEYRDRVTCRQVETNQRVVGGSSAARNGGASRERELLRQRYKRIRRHFEIWRVPAIVVVAVDAHHRLCDLTKLLPAAAAMVAGGAALIVMHHDALTDPRLGGRNGSADGADDACRLVAGDRGPADQRWHVRRLIARPAIILQIGAAHP
jgi:hypothetical protein